MATERTAEEAIDHLRHDYPDQEFQFTGLKKVCPRCARQGHVFVYSTPRFPEPRFAICWDGPSRLAKSRTAVEIGIANPAAVADFDLGMDVDDVLGPSFGYGYDRPKS